MRQRMTSTWCRQVNKAGRYWDTNGGGLGMSVGKTGTKTWIYQKSGGSTKSLGRWPAVTLVEARSAVAGFNADHDRFRPSVAKQTLGEALEDKKAALLEEGKSKRYVDYLDYQIKKYVPDWLDRPLNSLDRETLTKRLREVARNCGDKTKQVSGIVQSNRLRQGLKAIHNHAAEIDETLGSWPGPKRRPETTKYDRGEASPIVEDLARWRQLIEEKNSASKRDMLLFALYTGMRSETIRMAKHSDLKDGVLHIPNPKGGPSKAYDLPLPRQALEIVARQKYIAGSDWIFPGRNPDKPATLNPKNQPGPHRLRATLATELECLGAPASVLTAVLNHAKPGGVTGLYARAGERQELVREWLQKATNSLDVKMDHS